MSLPNLPYCEECFVCGRANPHGLRLKFQVRDKTVLAEFVAGPDHQGFKQMVHGGILSTLLDECMGWAPTLVTHRMTYTAELTIRFIQPAPLGTKLIITGTAESFHRRLYTSYGEIRDEQGTLYATGTGKYIPLSEEKTREVDSWLIYDPQTLKVFEE